MKTRPVRDLKNMIRNYGLSSRAKVYLASLFFFFLCGTAGASVETDPTTEALIDKVVALTERGDPAALEKTTGGYLIDASRRFNANIPADTWNAVRADVNEIISNKIRPGYGEQALLIRHFIKSAHFSNDELRHLMTMLQDPVMQKWNIAMRDSSAVDYMATLSQQVNNQMWFIVSIVLRRHGLQTTDTSSVAKQKQ
jgi:hypothetical protein